jgi:hypothetical protein
VAAEIKVSGGLCETLRPTAMNTCIVEALGSKAKWSYFWTCCGSTEVSPKYHSLQVDPREEPIYFAPLLQLAMPSTARVSTSTSSSSGPRSSRSSLVVETKHDADDLIAALSNLTLAPTSASKPPLRQTARQLWRANPSHPPVDVEGPSGGRCRKRPVGRCRIYMYRQHLRVKWHCCASQALRPFHHEVSDGDHPDPRDLFVVM